MTDPELPSGTASALAAAAQDPPPRVSKMLEGQSMEMTMGSPVLLLTLASQHLVAHARTLAAKAEREYYQFAVVFAHAACELHTEWAIDRLLSARTDKELAELVQPAERDVMSLDNDRILRIYKKLTCDDPKAADWWVPWRESRQDRHDVAHRGAVMTQDKALSAINLADRYMEHVTAKVGAALKRSP
jgi:hypothetical protein